MKEEYKNLHCSTHIYFMLKTLDIIIKSDYMINTEGITFYIPNNTSFEYSDCVYYPTVYEIFTYIKENFKLIIHINKLNLDKYEWIITDLNNNPKVYSGETEQNSNIGYAIGKNISKYRKYYNTEIKAIDEAITELLILI